MKMYVEIPRWDKRAREVFRALRESGEVFLTDLLALSMGKYGCRVFRVWPEDVGFALGEADKKLRKSDFYLVIDGKVALGEDVGERYNIGDVNVLIDYLLLRRVEGKARAAYNG